MLLAAVMVAVVLCCGAVKVAEAWGAAGHAIIAQIGYDRVSTAAQKAIKAYIYPAKGVEQIASDPDNYDHTNYGAWSAPLHFINMPKDAFEFQVGPDCPDPPSCVVEAILNFTSYLENNKTNPRWPHKEPSPVSFLIHFIGDCHQPLHVGYAYDQGGTLVPVDFYSTSTDLHDVWDTYIIQKWQPSIKDAISELQDKIAANQSIVNDALALSSPISWANQSFQYTRTDVYNFNPTEDPNANSNFDFFSLSAQERSKIAQSTPYLGDHYYYHNLPIVKTQLMRAGIRLGVVLEELFGSYNNVRMTD